MAEVKRLALALSGKRFGKQGLKVSSSRAARHRRGRTARMTRAGVRQTLRPDEFDLPLLGTLLDLVLFDRLRLHEWCVAADCTLVAPFSVTCAFGDTPLAGTTGAYTSPTTRGWKARAR